MGLGLDMGRGGLKAGALRLGGGLVGFGGMTGGIGICGLWVLGNERMEKLN